MSKKLNKDLIKEKLTLQDVEKVVRRLGGDCIIKDNHIECQTICHNLPSADNSYKLYYYENHKIFKCYTHCADSTFDIFELVQKAILLQTNEEINFYQAIQFVIKTTNLSVGELVLEDNQLSNNDIDYDKYSSIESVNEIQPVQCRQLENLSCLRILEWEKEFITYDTLLKFNIKYDGSQHKIIIPHYNENNKLIGIRGRAILKEDIARGKYAPVIYNTVLYNHPLGYNLYGLNLNKDNIREIRKVIIVESEKSVMQIEGYLNKNISVAVCGFNLTQWQINKLLEYGVEEFILGFDKDFQTAGDDEYWKYYKKVKRITDKIKNYATVSVMIDIDNILDYKDSPSDKGKEAFMQLLERRNFVKDEI